MSQLFSPSRARLLFRKYYHENRKSYGLLFLTCGASLTLLMGVNLSFTNPYLFAETAQVSYYFLGLILWGCLSASLLFSDLATKSKAINYLLVPASSLEKVLCTLIFGVVVYFIGYTLMFYGVDLIAVSLANKKFDTHWPIIDVFDINRYKSQLFDDGNTSYLFYIHFGLQSFFLLGSLYFPKYGLFKTAIVGVFLWVFLILLSVVIMKNYFPAGQFYEGFSFVEIFDPSGRLRIIELPVTFIVSLELFFKVGLVIGLWIVTYFRLKEKEI